MKIFPVSPNNPQANEARIGAPSFLTANGTHSFAATLIRAAGKDLAVGRVTNLPIKPLWQAVQIVVSPWP